MRDATVRPSSARGPDWSDPLTLLDRSSAQSRAGSRGLGSGTGLPTGGDYFFIRPSVQSQVASAASGPPACGYLDRNIWRQGRGRWRMTGDGWRVTGDGWRWRWLWQWRWRWLTVTVSMAVTVTVAVNVTVTDCGCDGDCDWQWPWLWLTVTVTVTVMVRVKVTDDRWRVTGDRRCQLVITEFSDRLGSTILSMSHSFSVSWGNANIQWWKDSLVKFHAGLS